MPRSPRSPQGKAVRITIYVEPDTKRRLTEYAAFIQQSPGEVIDKLVVNLWDNLNADAPIAPGPVFGASLPSLAGQPGVEHRAAAAEGTSVAAARTTYYDPPPETFNPNAFYDHPGWKLSATGQNVCTRCGKTKLRSKNASCTAPA